MMLVAFWALAEGLLVRIPGITPRLIDAAQSDWNARGFLAMLRGSFCGVPYKLFAYAAALTGLRCPACSCCLWRRDCHVSLWWHLFPDCWANTGRFCASLW